MRIPPSRLALLALAACTAPPPGGRHAGPQRFGSADLLRDHERDFVWVESPAFHPLPGYQTRTRRLRVLAAEDGVHLVDRAARDPDWKVSLSARTLGRVGAGVPLPPGKPWADHHALELLRGDVVEFLENDPDRGLEHGYRLLRRPDGSGPVELDLAVDGARTFPTADGALFLVPGKQIVGWRGLRVEDADGRPLPARTVASADGLAVRFDDDGARWPVTIDPLVTEFENSITPFGASASAAGWSVAVDGDLLLVGNPGFGNTNGTAGLFERNTDGEDAWGLISTFDTDTANDNREGIGVALLDDTVLLGKLDASTPSVRVFELDGNWGNFLTGNPAGPATTVSVALGDDVFVAGAPSATGGTAAVYSRVTSALIGTIGAVDVGGTDDELGAAVAASGDWVAVGYPGDDGVVLEQVTHEVFGDEVLHVAHWTGARGSRLGQSVAIEDDLLVAGSASGVRVFHRTGADWADPLEVEVTDLPLPPTADATFGRRVALSAGTLAVTDDAAPVRVYLFDWDGSAFRPTQILDTGATNLLTPSLALSESILAVGVPDANTVQVYRRTGDRWVVDTAGGTAQSRFGAAVAIDGDVAVVGAPHSDAAGLTVGEAFVFTRDGMGTWSLADSIQGTTDGEEYGTAVAIEGDRVVVGAPSLTVGASVEVGRVQILDWDGSRLTIEKELASPEVAANEQFGRTVAIDSQKLLVGAPGHASFKGGAFLYAEEWTVTDPAGWGRYPTSTSVFLEGTATSQGTGTKACFSAIAIDGPWIACSSGPADDEDGELRLQDWVAGSGPVVVTGSAGAREKFGSSLSLDGDALAVGARWSGAGDEGRVDVYRLSPAGVWTLEQAMAPAVPNTQLGTGVALQGDRLVVGGSSGNRLEFRTRNAGGVSNWGQTGLASLSTGTYGEAVALDGAVVLVGAPNRNGTGEVEFREWDANLAPMCWDQEFFVLEEQVINAHLEVDDPDDDGLVFTIVTAPANDGFFSLTAAGVANYEGEIDFWGDDQLVYQATDGQESCTAVATFHVIEVNDPPVAVDDAFVSDEDQVLLLAASVLVANDTDPDEPEVDETLVPNRPTGALHGTVERQGADFTYTPDENWFGTEVLTYTVHDSRPIPGTSGPATLTIEVRPVNDPPVLGATATAFSVDEDGTFVSPPPGLFGAVIDVDGDPLSANVLTPPAHGSLALEPNGYWRYVPDRDWNGVDGFSYEVADPYDAVGPVAVTMTVDPVDDPPVVVDDGVFAGLEDNPLDIPVAVLLANDGDIDGDPLANFSLDTMATNGTVSTAGSIVTFVPRGNHAGPASFRYRVEAAGVPSAYGTVTLDFREVNDPPVGASETLDAIAEVPLVTNLLANDLDPDGDPLTAALVTRPGEGAATLDPDGTFTYTARAGFDGADAFTYVIADGRGGTATVAATIHVDAEPGTEPEPHTAVDPEGCDDPQTFYVDRDGDGFGDPATSRVACAAAGWVGDATDCDDFESGVFPGAAERSGDGVDQDCDGRDNVLAASGACACDSTPPPLAWVPLSLLGGLVARRRRGLR